MLIGIEIKTNTGRDAKNIYYKHECRLTKHASLTMNGSLRTGAQPLATATFGENDQDLVAVTTKQGEFLGYLRFSDLVFASQEQLEIGSQFNIFYVPKKYYGKSSDKEGVLRVIDDILMCCERFKNEGF